MKGFVPGEPYADATPYRASLQPPQSAGGAGRDRFRIEAEKDTRALLGLGHESKEH